MAIRGETAMNKLEICFDLLISLHNVHYGTY